MINEEQIELQERAWKNFSLLKRSIPTHIIYLPYDTGISEEIIKLAEMHSRCLIDLANILYATYRDVCKKKCVNEQLKLFDNG